MTSRFLLNTIQTAAVALLWANLVVGDDIDFVRDIRPILSDKCFHCHGPDKGTREADLRLDRQESAFSNDVVVPGDLGRSTLVGRIVSDDEAEMMPPLDVQKPLSADEIQILQQWVTEGAQWSRHWAFERPVRYEPSQVPDDAWSANWIDQFVLARLEKENLAPTKRADSETLLRRISFDLTGLPPTRNHIQRLSHLSDEKTFAAVVEELLESPHYGERMAIYWLDLVRYADTVGYHGDQDHNIHPYRDWVIDAFNKGMPFDQFTREQLAGDLLDHPTVGQKTATGYNRLLQTTHEGGLQKKEYRAIYAADRVRNVSAVWMGATVGCAQCHDHKFDPYSSKDFYSLAAFFADIDDERHFRNGTNSLPTRREPELVMPTDDQEKQLAELDLQIEALERSIAEKDIGKDQKSNQQEQLDLAVEARKVLDKQVIRTMITVALPAPRVTRILDRGNWQDESGEIVQPAVPQFLQPDTESQGRQNRMDLANWLVDAENGNGLFTARVMVNRIWYLFFGTGLAANLDDFGGQGEAPVHPELLDRLAFELIENDWDIKAVIRLIVTSQTYQQSSVSTNILRERDPSNRLYARQSAFRLPAEMIRDNALAVSGLLRREVGGPSVKPYQPAGYYRHLNFPTRKYQSHEDDRQWRRGLYVHWQRQFLHPMLKAFDAPGREECTAQRARSNTPLAALTLLNDPTFVEAARQFAVRCLEHSADSDCDRITWAFQQAVTRTPSPEEKKLLTELLKEHRQLALENRETAKLVDVGISEHNQQLEEVELASWTTVCRALLNLAETNTRN